ncbi:DUF3801 domain-containing protein [Bacillus thuringiensis]
MTTVDENTKVAIEIIGETTKLTQQTLLFILKALMELLENKEHAPKNFILAENDKVGKQKINELIHKHQNNGGVVSLDENLTKQQVHDYQKELKKLGVDFSIVKNSKDDYSFFFSAAQHK